MTNLDDIGLEDDDEDGESVRAQMTDPRAIRRFILAGSAIFTIQSGLTGVRFTYRVVHPEGKPHFVFVLTGPNNYADYTFLGTIFESTTYRYGYRSVIGRHATSKLAFDYLWKGLSAGWLYPAILFFHEGLCGRCGLRLTVPKSVEQGLGPICTKLSW